jgi:hypothetical protein
MTYIYERVPGLPPEAEAEFNRLLNEGLQRIREQGSEYGEGATLVAKANELCLHALGEQVQGHTEAEHTASDGAIAA